MLIYGLYFRFVTIENSLLCIRMWKRKYFLFHFKNKRVVKLNEEKNNCLIREKIAIDKIENTKDFIIPEFKEKIKKVIDNTKGNLSKKKVIELINNIE